MTVHLEVLLLQADDDADFLRLNLHHVSPLELTQGVDARSPISAQLKIFGQNLKEVAMDGNERRGINEHEQRLRDKRFGLNVKGETKVGRRR